MSAGGGERCEVRARTWGLGREGSGALPRCPGSGRAALRCAVLLLGRPKARPGHPCSSCGVLVGWICARLIAWCKNSFAGMEQKFVLPMPW